MHVHLEYVEYIHTDIYLGHFWDKQIVIYLGYQGDLLALIFVLNHLCFLFMVHGSWFMVHASWFMI